MAIWFWWRGRRGVGIDGRTYDGRSRVEGRLWRIWRRWLRHDCATSCSYLRARMMEQKQCRKSVGCGGNWRCGQRLRLASRGVCWRAYRDQQSTQISARALMRYTACQVNYEKINVIDKNIRQNFICFIMFMSTPGRQRMTLCSGWTCAERSCLPHGCPRLLGPRDLRRQIYLCDKCTQSGKTATWQDKCQSLGTPLVVISPGGGEGWIRA